VKKLLLVASVLFAVHFGTAQEIPFATDIARFAAKDLAEASLLAESPVLFIGSSSFTLWKDVADYFPNHKIINRAFGGSRLSDQIYFLEEVALKYQPKKIFLYCGENDVAGGANAEVVADRFKIWFRQIRKHLPNCTIVYVSMKPSPSREKFLPVMLEANQKIREYIAKQNNIQYVDITPLMLNADGKPRTDIFLNDKLHMNQDGYKLWQKALEPYL
jgi:lysophospholipase L1-like esterase